MSALVTGATAAPAPRRGVVRLAWLALLVGISLLPVRPAEAAVSRPDDLVVTPLEQGVKAAFLYHFTKFVEWPATPEGAARPAMIIGVMGEDELMNLLIAGVAGKTVGDRAVVVKRLETVAESRGCQVVFLGSARADRLPELLVATADQPILIVGDAPGFAARGGTIGFFRQEGKVRFAINLAAATRAHLKLSSRLLNLATLVREDPR